MFKSFVGFDYMCHEYIENTLDKVNPDVSVTSSDSFSHSSGVKCFATRLLVDLISGNGSA